MRANRELLREVSDGIIGLGHFADKAKQRGYRFTVEEAKTSIRERHGDAVSGGGSTSTTADVATAAVAVTAVGVIVAS